MVFVNIFDNEGDSNRTQILEKLLQKVKQYYNEEKQESVIVEIANLVLQSRPLCRRYKGQPLEGIYQEIYEEVSSYLLEQISQKCLQLDLVDLITYEWLDLTQTGAFKAALNDARLKELAINAQKQSPNTALRSYALTELVKAIEISNQLCHPHRGLFANDFYPLIYEEALVQTITYICTNIDKYDPERGKGKFMSWVNFKLDKTVLACRRQFDLSYKYRSVSLGEIEIIADRQNTPNMSDLLYECIQKDPKGVFQKTYISDRPEANFQSIALKRLSGKAWKEIARELQVNIPVLSAFYQRNSHKFKTLLQELLES